MNEYVALRPVKTVKTLRADSRFSQRVFTCHFAAWNKDKLPLEVKSVKSLK